jgi:hypothetical protein
MPHVAGDGHVAHGRGSTGAFLDNAPIDTGGDATWLTPGVVAYQHGGVDGWYLARYDLATRQTGRLVTDPSDLHYGRGANALAAGGGVWAAWLGGYGLYSSTEIHFPTSSLLDVGPDGAIGYKPNYQADGGGAVIEQSGEIWTLTEETVFELHLVGQRRAVWRNNGAMVRVTGLPQPVTLSGGVYTPRAVQVEGVWWLCYYSAGAKSLVLHPFDSTVGYAITGGDAWPDVTVLSGTTVRVVWSVTLGEAAGDVLMRDIDVAREPRMELNVEPEPPDPPDPPDPPEPEPVEPPTITITEYDQSGVAPCDCAAVAELSGGPAETITWLRDDAPEPLVVPLELMHLYHFDAPGSYSIGVRVVGPGGGDETGSPRIVTITAAQPEPPEPPEPEPEPPAGGGVLILVSTIQISEPAYLNWRYGGGQSLDPPTNPDDPNRDPFEHGRPVAGVDETGNLYQFVDETYGIQSPNGRSWVSVQGDGSLEEREVVEGQEPGPWERFTREGNVLTELPKEGAPASRAPVTFVQP